MTVNPSAPSSGPSSALPAAGPVPPAPADPPADTHLAALRAEIDALDDALHGLLERRAAVVTQLANSRAKADGPVLRPAREAQVLRRLLGRGAGALPPAALVRLWREIFATSIALQGSFAVSVCSQGEDQLRLAREHFGVATALRHLPSATRALAAVAAGETQAAVLPVPEEGVPGTDWWTGLESPRLQVAARLPFWSPPRAPNGGQDEGPAALVVVAGAAEPSGQDRSLLLVEAPAGHSRAHVAQDLAAAGLPPRRLLLLRGSGQAASYPAAPFCALAELEGFVAAGDPRLAALPFSRIKPLGAFAVPEPGAALRPS